MTSRKGALAAILLLAGTMAAQAETAGQDKCWDQAAGQVRERQAAVNSGSDGHEAQDVPVSPDGSVAAPRKRSTAPSSVATSGATGSNAGSRPAAAAGLPNC